MNNPRPIILDGEAYQTGICPECFGMALVLNHLPTLEYQNWAQRKSCQNMIEYLEADGNSDLIDDAERRYAYGEAA